MPASPSVDPHPPRCFVDRQLRPDADRAFRLGMDLLIAALSLSEGRLAGDTANHGRILHDAMQEGISRVVKASRLYGQRAALR